MRNKILLICLFAHTQLAHADDKIALDKIQSFAAELKTTLVSAMAKGPQHAITVCKDQATQIAKKHSTNEVQIGRVSHKARNPNNTVRDWMQESVDLYLQKKISADYQHVEISKTKYGIIKPIKTGGVCLTCHGEQIPKNLQNKLTEHYPKDMATGFKNGEIRGFFYAIVNK